MFIEVANSFLDHSINNHFSDGLLGDYDYAHLFTPRLPFTKQARKSAPFFGLNDRVPVVLALILGLQHALAMLAGGESHRRTWG